MGVRTIEKFHIIFLLLDETKHYTPICILKKLEPQSSSEWIRLVEGLVYKEKLSLGRFLVR